MGLFPILYRHDRKPERQLQAATGTATAWDTLDSTPEARYDVFVELGPQRANVASPRLANGPGGATEGGWGIWPSAPGWNNDARDGFKPAYVEFTDLSNAGVFEPPGFGGGVQMTTPPNWYDGGAMTPMWQQANNVTPQPAPWDSGLTIGYGPPVQVLR